MRRKTQMGFRGIEEEKSAGNMSAQLHKSPSRERGAPNGVERLQGVTYQFDGLPLHRI